MMNKHDCWTIDEIKEFIERLLLDKQTIQIKRRPLTYERTDTSWLVEWEDDNIKNERAWQKQSTSEGIKSKERSRR